MPILKGTASFSRFRVETDGKGAKSAKRDFAKALKLRAFEPLDPGSSKRRDPDDDGLRAHGFVELENKDLTEFSPGATMSGVHALFAYRVDEIRIPSAAVRAELTSWERAFEAENQRPPGRKEKNERKAEIHHTLRARYPATTKTFDVSWNLTTDFAQIWAGSRKAVDEVQAAVEQAFTVKLVPVAPITIATQLGIAEKALSPTPALSMPEEEQKKGGAHGKA